jgi:hypothetical protein
LAKIERRQSRLRDAIVARDATRQADKLLVPLPSAGLAPFCAALKNPAVCAAAG